MEKIKVIATLQDTRNGFTKDYIEEMDKEAFIEVKELVEGEGKEVEVTEKEIEDNRRFMWLEGNWSCDCNRSLFLYDGDETKELPCSAEENVIELLKLTVNDKVIYEKTKSPNSTE